MNKRVNNKKVLDDLNIVWKPNPGSQSLFLSCPFHQAFYTGTRAVGKTDALIMDFFQDVGKGYGSDWVGILFRRTYKQLSDLVIKSKKWFRMACPKADFNKSDYTWVFPDGELLMLRYFWDRNDYDNYHGHSYAWIGWEELLNWSDLDCYQSMMSCNRATGVGVPTRVRSTGNPWGIGRSAVKNYFVDPAPWGTVINEKGHKRVTIFGNMLENIPFMKMDPKYRSRLLALPDKELIKAWVYGRWDVNVGGFFSDVWSPQKNVIPLSKTFIPPRHWYCFRSFDWGSGSPFSVGWWTESDGTTAPNGITYPRGALIRFAEWYGNDKHAINPNTGLRLLNKKIGEGIIEREKKWPSLKIRKGPADNQIFEERGGDSIAKQMSYDLFVQSDKTRIAGWQQLRGRFEGEVPEDGSLLYVMETCSDFIRTVPFLVRDDKNTDDIADNQEDHIADETRYACMFRKRARLSHIFNVSDIYVA